MSQLSRPVLALALCAAIAACGSAPADVTTPNAPPSAIPTTTIVSARLLEWPEFGLDHVIEPESNANDHSLSGTLDLFSAR